MEENTTADEKISKAFHRIICRMSNDKEKGILKSYYEEQLQQFKQKQLDAAATLNVGEYPQHKNMDMNATAALMKVINMIYNMEEAITKN
jgi:hypothetical protein